MAATPVKGRKIRGRTVVGLLPAAGHSRRLSPIPCSKELLPVGLGPIPGVSGMRPKVVSHYLLESWCRAQISTAYIVLRQGKWDIPSYWVDGQRLGMTLAYLVIADSIGPPDTLDRSYLLIKDKVVAFGFPDIIIRPENVFDKLLRCLNRSRADVVLGLFRAHDHRVMDMINWDKNGRVRGVELKPRETVLEETWVCAVWTPVFTEFLHQYLHRLRARPDKRVVGNIKIDPQGDVPVGAVIQAAIKEGVRVEGVRFSNGDYLDIGTPDALLQCAERFGWHPSVE